MQTKQFCLNSLLRASNICPIPIYFLYNFVTTNYILSHKWPFVLSTSSISLQNIIAYFNLLVLHALGINLFMQSVGFFLMADLSLIAFL